MIRLFITACTLIVLITACDGKPSSSQGKAEVLTVPKVAGDKEQAGKEDLLPPEVKIKLKRDGKDNYSWELSGSDVDQVLKVNEKLRKKLGGEQQK
jgi:hypothetical protein